MSFLDKMESKVKMNVREYKAPKEYDFLKEENEVMIDEADLDKMLQDNSDQEFDGEGLADTIEADYGDEEDEEEDLDEEAED